VGVIEPKKSHVLANLRKIGKLEILQESRLSMISKKIKI
jgi:hypothetical protein